MFSKHKRTNKAKKTSAQKQILDRTFMELLGNIQNAMMTRLQKLIKDCRHHLRKYPNCSVAQGRTYPLEVPDRESAHVYNINVFINVCYHGFIFIVCDKWPVFKDAKLYRFRKDDSTFPFNIEVNVFMHGQRMYEQLLQLRQEKGVAYEPSFPGYMLIDWLLQNGEIEKHGIIQHVSLKHHFFDSGLLYQFCINFRRWRCLSELLHETENEEVKCITHQSQEDQADSPFTLYKTPPCEGNSYFLSVLKRHVTCEELLSPGAPYVKRVLMVSLGFVVRGKSPCYVQAVDPGSSAVAARIRVIITLNGRSVLHLDYCTLSKVVMTGPRVVTLEVMEPVD
uniref:Si:dkeyp-97e7.9 n=1 Tax=Cyprinus carpio TaxID=7962 RepID=A0A8C2DQK4_CYPCA